MREQHFGIAEGESYRQARQPGLSLEEHYAKGIFPAMHDRTAAFPGGESLVDVAARAEQVIDDIIVPKIVRAAEGKQNVTHVAIVSHGLFLAELVAALVKRGGEESALAREYRGLWNTAWTRVTADLMVGYLTMRHRLLTTAHPQEPWPRGGQEDMQGEVQESVPVGLDRPTLCVRITHTNQYQHLQGLVRTKNLLLSAQQLIALADKAEGRNWERYV